MGVGERPPRADGARAGPTPSPPPPGTPAQTGSPCLGGCLSPSLATAAPLCEVSPLPTKPVSLHFCVFVLILFGELTVSSASVSPVAHCVGVCVCVSVTEVALGLGLASLAAPNLKDFQRCFAFSYWYFLPHSLHLRLKCLWHRTLSKRNACLFLPCVLSFSTLQGFVGQSKGFLQPSRGALSIP